MLYFTDFTSLELIWYNHSHKINKKQQKQVVFETNAKVLVFIRLSLIVVPNPFSFDAAPNETIPTVLTIGPHDCVNKIIIDINKKFLTYLPFLKNIKLK